MIDEGKPIEVKCHFCNKAYEFKVNELEDMLKKATSKQLKCGCGNKKELCKELFKHI